MQFLTMSIEAYNLLLSVSKGLVADNTVQKQIEHAILQFEETLNNIDSQITKLDEATRKILDFLETEDQKGFYSFLQEQMH